MTKKGFMAHTNSIIMKTDRKYLVVNWFFIPFNDQTIERFRLRYNRPMHSAHPTMISFTKTISMGLVKSF